MKRVVWYDLRKDFPLIAPDMLPRTQQVKKGSSSQAISARPKNPQNSQQFLLLPTEPKLAQADVPAPNLLQMVAPKLPQPERPKPKPFRAPVAAQPKTEAKIAALEPAPSAVSSPKAVDVPNLLEAAALPRPERPKPKPFQPPPIAPQPRTEATIPNMELPAPAGQAPLPISAGRIEMLIVNQHPANTLSVIPEGGRNARVETGTASGAGTETVTGGGNGIIAPGLSVSGSPEIGAAANNGVPAEKSRPAVRPPAAPQAPRFAEVPMPRAARGISVAYWPGARTIAPAIEGRFTNRVAYVTVMEAPPGFPTQDWVLWFAEMAPTDFRLRPVIRPPAIVLAAVPVTSLKLLGRKLPAIGFLRKTGRIDSLSVLDPQADSALARSYFEAIEESTFTPATHNGQPVDVEIFLEIAPATPRIQSLQKQPLKMPQ
jgi:hypothetical protein